MSEPLTDEDLEQIKTHSPYTDVERLIAEILRLRGRLALAEQRVEYELASNEHLREQLVQQRAMGRKLSEHITKQEREIERLRPRTSWAYRS